MTDDQEQDAVNEPGQDEKSLGDQEESTEPPDEEQADEQEPDELEISFGDEKEEEDEPSESHVFADLRNRHKSLKKKYRQTLHELEQLKVPAKDQAIDPGAKPTLEGCDYDSDQYENQLSDWYEKKRKADQHAEKIAARQKEEEAAQQKIYQNYNERRQNLKVKDYKEAEEEVIEGLDIPKQNIILKYAKKPELIVYALGKSPSKLAELAKLDDIAFAKELGRLEDNLKVGKRKPKTQPEKTISSTGSLSGTVDRTLDKLREDAARTGNYTKVNEYKRKKRRAG